MKVLFGILKYLFVVLVVSTLVGSVLGVGVLIYFSQGLPNIITIEDYKPATVTRVLGKNDVVVGEFFEERRYVVPLDKIPDMVQKAFIAAEDDRFFDHQGVDLQGILRAAIANFRAGRMQQGGSTITQQVAKNLLLTPERTLFRKIKEVILANRMEKNLNKKQILYLYLNQIYLGQGAYGVEAASRVYFNKSAKDLTLAEAALLGGLPQAPSKYSPLLNSKMAKQRQAYVLRRLFEDGSISQAKMEEALREKVKVYLSQDVNTKYAPYYVEHVRKYLLEKYGKEALYQMGLTARTSIDSVLSVVARNSLREGLRSVDKKQGYRGPIRRNRSNEEIAEAIAQAEEYNVSQKFPFKVLMPDGTHATDAKTRLGEGNSELDAFDVDQIYQGIVSTVDDRKREVWVNLGIGKGVIPFEKMAWAAPAKLPSDKGYEALSRPSQALAKGDLIWVKAAAKNVEQKTLTLSLEQEPIIQGSLLSMDVRTGEVISMVGGYDFKESEFNRAIQAERQPGSCYKPIIYSAALDKGYTPATIIQDSPIVFSAGENEKWKPENYEEKFYGDTLFRSALIRSRNIPTIKIVQDIGVNFLIDYSKRLGLPDKFNRDLSIALGSSTASLLDLLKAYAIFPRGGRVLKPLFLLKVSDRDGKALEEHPLPAMLEPAQSITATTLPVPPKRVQVAGELQTQPDGGSQEQERATWVPDPADPDRVMDPRTAYVMTHLMNEVATVGTGQGAKALGRPAAGKTGTTNDYLDAWFIGFTPQIATGVWVGFDAERSIGPKSTGALVALPIWLDYMKEAVKGYPEADFNVPKGVVFTYIDGKSGKLSSSNKPNSIREAFVEGTEPTGAMKSPLIVAPGGMRPAAAATPGAQPAGLGTADEEDQSSDDFFKEDIE